MAKAKKTGSLKVAVGSENPVKVEAVRWAFEKVWLDQKTQVVGLDLDSGVPSQPMSDAESIKGARGRARKAIADLSADYGVGIEGGLQKIAGQYFTCGWAVVVDKKGREGIGSSLRMEVPPQMMGMIREGKELGEVIDVLFERKNAKQAEGHFGLMTKNALTRTHAYRDGVVSALARFITPQVFEG